MTANEGKIGTLATVTVELFGTARLNAGASAITLHLDAGATVADFARELISECPSLIGSLFLEGGGILDGWALSRNGLSFVPMEPDTPLRLANGDALLLLPSQAGG